jgi:hypothetical protein
MPIPTTNRGWTPPAIGASNWGTTLNTLFDAVDSDTGTLFTDRAAFNTEANLVAAAHNSTSPATAAGKISLEVKNARGSASNMANRLTVSLNDDGTLKSATAAPDQWIASGMTTPAYATTKTFTIAADVTAILLPGMTLKIDYSVSADRFYRVKNATHSGGTTTVTVWDADNDVLNEAITAVYYQSFGKPNYLDVDASDFLPGAISGSIDAAMSDAQFDAYYYNAASFDDPFNTTGARVAKTNSGLLAYIEYESGQQYGVVYDSVASGKVSTVQRRMLKGGTQTAYRIDTMVYDGTTGFITDGNRT